MSIEKNANTAGVTRKEFLQQAGAATLGLAALGGLTSTAKADPYEPTEPVRLGSGDHTYDCVHNWLMPPPTILWGRSPRPTPTPGQSAP